MAISFVLCGILSIILVLVAVGGIIALVLRYLIPKRYQVIRGLFGWISFFVLTYVALLGVFKLFEKNTYVLVVVENNENYSKYRVFGDGEGVHVQGKTAVSNGKTYIDNRSDKDVVISPIYYGDVIMIRSPKNDEQIIKTGTVAECEHYPDFFFEEPSSIKVDKNKDGSLNTRWVLKYLRFNILPDSE